MIEIVKNEWKRTRFGHGSVRPSKSGRSRRQKSSISNPKFLEIFFPQKRRTSRNAEVVKGGDDERTDAKDDDGVGQHGRVRTGNGSIEVD